MQAINFLRGFVRLVTLQATKKNLAGFCKTLHVRGKPVSALSLTRPNGRGFGSELFAALHTHRGLARDGTSAVSKCQHCRLRDQRSRVRSRAVRRSPHSLRTGTTQYVRGKRVSSFVGCREWFGRGVEFFYSRLVYQRLFVIGRR